MNNLVVQIRCQDLQQKQVLEELLKEIKKMKDGVPHPINVIKALKIYKAINWI